MRVFACVCLLLALPVQAAEDRLPFWRVSTANGTLYLLGSIHLARAEFYPLRERIMQAFEASRTLVVEVDIAGARIMQLQQQTLLRGSYPPGQSIHDELSATTWTELERELAAVGLPAGVMESMRPGLVVSMLTSMHMMALGLRPELGIDRHFLDLAHSASPAAKEIVELETIDQQLDLLFDFPDKNLLVLQTLAQLDGLEDLMAQLLDVWQRGDAPGMAKLLLEDELAHNPQFKPIYERLFDVRNIAMTGRLRELMQRGGQYFVVVGSGHLVGDQGIVALLQQQGYRPEQL
jgi:uncharacterized protein YbaP (TraB family)